MIPYTTLNLWGPLVVAGIALGAVVARYRANQLGIRRHELREAILVVLAFGFVGAHVFAELSTRPSAILKPWTLVDPRVGLEIGSVGGFIGGLLGLAVWAAATKRSWLANADVLAFGLAPAWILARLGCFTAHDHPGILTSSIAAVRYPDGPRHDLGLYEAAAALVITLVFVCLVRRTPRAGTFLVLFCVLYGPIRFGLDFLRIETISTAFFCPRPDRRYGGLTAAQYVALGMTGAGAIGLKLITSRSRARREQ